MASVQIVFFLFGSLINDQTAEGESTACQNVPFSLFFICFDHCLSHCMLYITWLMEQMAFILCCVECVYIVGLFQGGQKLQSAC